MLRRLAGAARGICSALTQALHKSGASVVLNSSVSCLDKYFCPPGIIVNWKPLVSCSFFFLRGNKFHIENTIFRKHYFLFDFRLFFFVVLFFFSGRYKFSSQLMSYPLVQELLFERKIWKLHGVFLQVSCARPGVGLDNPHGSLPT